MWAVFKQVLPASAFALESHEHLPNEKLGRVSVQFIFLDESTYVALQHPRVAGKDRLGYWPTSRYFCLASGPNTAFAMLRMCMVCMVLGQATP